MKSFNLNWRFIIRVIGSILGIESLFIFLSAAISFYFHEWVFEYLIISGGICLTTSILLLYMGSAFSKSSLKKDNIGKREGFITVTGSWMAFACFGTIPFYISGAIPSLADAFFETMSGLTTTGSTILTDIEALPKGLLFWRSLTQWLGGMGMIVFSLALLPLLGGGASQLFDAETTGITHDKFRPRAGQVAKRLWGIYAGLTGILVVLLYLGPMSLFDALCHSLTTMSTGGYSTKQSSISYWNSAYVDYIVIIFMFIGSINFSLIYFFFKGNFKKVLKDEELRWFTSIVVVVSLILTVTLVSDDIAQGHLSSLRSALFQVVSIISSSGFATGDYVAWGHSYSIIFVFLMMVCGCAGSTSGGLKTIRLVVLSKNTINEFRKQIHPRAIMPVRVNGSALPMNVVQKIVAFSFLYISIILLSWLFLSLTGLNLEEALGASVTAISNAGPGLGQNGPSGNFANISDVSKWYMSFLMLVGRLEIFTVLVLFTPGFWKE